MLITIHGLIKCSGAQRHIVSQSLISLDSAFDKRMNNKRLISSGCTAPEAPERLEMKFVLFTKTTWECLDTTLRKRERERDGEEEAKDKYKIMLHSAITEPNSTNIHWELFKEFKDDLFTLRREKNCWLFV